MGYYRKFIKGYGFIATPLTALIWKNSFHWSTKVENSFHALKKDVTTPPVLALPGYTKPFTIQCDTSGCGIKAVLLQQGRLIALMSQVLMGRALNLSTYEKKLLAFVLLVRKWRAYVLM